jgi:hypothetical protein
MALQQKPQRPVQVDDALRNDAGILPLQDIGPIEIG